MEFKVLSHACLLIKHGKSSLIIDPWLLGSCYWRSWWNFPKPMFVEEELANVDAVIISHIHWDHWHGPTLKKFFRGKPIILPDEPGLRSEKDLKTIGFKEVRRIPHGQKTKVGELTVTLYQFGRYLNDAAVVIEGGGVTLLNANDAKIAGWALRQIAQRHGKIDFVFRSHSSANSRVCYHITGEDNFASDDRDHYFRSFISFMDAVKPTFAIPFASNHCHLHEDVYAMNSYISNPLQLRDFCNKTSKDWQLQVMMPGSAWSQDTGFALAPETEFENLNDSLAAYLAEMETKLEAYRTEENNVKINDKLLERFMGFFKAHGRPAKCTGKFRLVLRWPDQRRVGFECDIETGHYKNTETDSIPTDGIPIIEMPVIIFRDSVAKNMFHHATISKRCRFLANDSVDMNRLQRIVSFLDLNELGVFPKSRAYSFRLINAYVRRWRELTVYAHALWLLKIRRKPLYLVEEAILRGEF